MQVADLQGAELDYWVYRALGGVGTFEGWLLCRDQHYSTKWADGGPIVQEARIDITPPPKGEAIWFSGDQPGHTALVAAMRCYVARRFGSDVSSSPHRFVADIVRNSRNG
jgi:hypothetical protein